MSDKLKILVCGDVAGKFKTLFKRVQTINEKNGPFECVLCVGDFFGPSSSEWEQVKTGSTKAPVPTYILGPNMEIHENYYGSEENNELCQNIYYLGRRGVFTLSSGLKLVYASGTSTATNHRYQITEDDVLNVRDICFKSNCHFRGADILLTSEWPQGVTSLDDAKPESPPSGSPLLSWLAAHIRPRYHFSGLYGIHYERVPYRMDRDRVYKHFWNRNPCPEMHRYGVSAPDG